MTYSFDTMQNSEKGKNIYGKKQENYSTADIRSSAGDVDIDSTYDVYVGNRGH